jgi:hypothetical protein
MLVSYMDSQLLTTVTNTTVTSITWEAHLAETDKNFSSTSTNPTQHYTALRPENMADTVSWESNRNFTQVRIRFVHRKLQTLVVCKCLHDEFLEILSTNACIPRSGFASHATTQSAKTWKIGLYKVVQIWPGQTVTSLHTNRPGHIWTTL